MKKLMLITVISAFVASPALADMTITAADGVGSTLGGEFIVTVTGDPIGIYGTGATISTFCIESQEFIYLDGRTFYVTLSNAAIKGGQPVSDPLNAQSAGIYNYWLDTLAHTQANANDVQNALWHEEGEGGSHNYLNDLTGLDTSNVMVMNLWNDAAHTSNAQDLLVRVPVPGAILLGMLGLSVAGIKLRKHA